MQLAMLKKCFPALLAALFAIMLVSCSDDDSTVNMHNLLDYRFVYVSTLVMEDSTTVVTDSVEYNFVSFDSLVVAHSYSGNGLSMLGYSKDTAYIRPVVAGNRIRFQPPISTGVYPTDYLTNFEWEVLSLSSQELRLALIVICAPPFKATLKCVPK